MQLDNHSQKSVRPESKKSFKNISSALAVASLSVVSMSSPALAKDDSGEWAFDAAVLYYAESDDRVMAVEPVFSATRTFEEGEKLNLKAVFDSLTGASPNGATPSENIQTFSRPSGNGTYEIGANESPLDDTFKDTRIALSANWSAPWKQDWDYSAGIYASNEYDYFSLGLNGGLTRYLNQKNTALNIGLSYEADMIEPVGGAPIGFAEMAHQSSPSFDADLSASREDTSDSKGVLDVLMGVSQVIDRQTIMQFNYGLSFSDGYLNDPYKFLSVIDNSAGPNFGANVQDANGNNIYLYEQRPDSRLKNTLYWQLKHSLDSGDIVDASYRFMFDDWGINSHTFDLSYSWNLGSSFLTPHVRFYQQGEADFYQRYMTATEYNGGMPTLKEASSDYRLSELTSTTLGLKYAWTLNSGDEMNVRLEYFLQSHDGEQKDIGQLAGQDLYPDMDALMVKFGYSF